MQPPPTLYLLPTINAKLRPQLWKQLKVGTRVVSHQFNMRDWEPDQVIRVGTNTGYFWTVPAVVAGQWTVQGLDSRGTARLQLTQRHQRVGGTLAWGSQVQPLLGARLDGAQLHFSYVNTDGLLQAAKLQVQGPTLSGELVGPYGMVEVQPEVVKLSGQRVAD